MGQSFWIAEQRTPRDQHIGAGCRRRTDRGRSDPAVDLEIDGACQPRIVDHRPDLADLRLHRGDVLLASKAGVDRHDEHEIDEIEHVRDGRCGCRRVESHSRRRPERPDVGQSAVKMLAGFGMDDESRAPGSDVFGGEQIRIEHHEVSFEGQ